MTVASARTGVAVAAALMALVAGCNDSTEPEPFDSGDVEFAWMSEGETTPVLWSASGSCGSRGFDLGSAECAVGANEGQYWAVLGVFVNADDDTFDTVTLVHPPQEGSCEASFEAGTATTCTVEFIRGRTTFPVDPIPHYIMTSGTITFTREGDRIVGSFEGTAEDFSEDQLAPIEITGGGFDVDFVQ